MASQRVNYVNSMSIFLTLLIIATNGLTENAALATKADPFKLKMTKSVNNVDAAATFKVSNYNNNYNNNNNNLNNHYNNNNNNNNNKGNIHNKVRQHGSIGGSEYGRADSQDFANNINTDTDGYDVHNYVADAATTTHHHGRNEYFQPARSSGINQNIIEMPDMQPEQQHNGGPYFDKTVSKNVTALLGKTAYLTCRVKNLGNKTVSWVRHRDVHLLTVGRYTYTTDQRFRAIHQPHSEDWILQIKYPQYHDSGIYECQISAATHLSHYIHFNVVEPDTEILGAPDLYIESGSTINLTCVILNSPEPPLYVFWNHNTAIITPESVRGGITIDVQKGLTTVSTLLIKSARSSDSGQYQCNPSNAKSKAVTVHVLNGEYPAAMQRADRALHQNSGLQYTFICCCTLLFLAIYGRQHCF